MDAVDRLRESARNERTVLDSVELLDLKNKEITRLQSENATLRAENERMKGQHETVGWIRYKENGDLYIEWRTSIIAQEGDAIYTDPTNLAAKVAELTADNAALTEALKHDRVSLQADAKHPSPCQKFCEATAFRIDERRMQRRISELTEQLKVARHALERYERAGVAPIVAKEALAKLQGVE